MRQSLVVANWKMHGSRSSVEALLDGLLATPVTGSAQVALCPAFLHVAQVLSGCEGHDIAVGAQDCSHAVEGAYTGEVSAAMLADLGCNWVILGHSERRQYHAESDELVAAKLGAAVTAGLRPILCVGESREQRESGEAEAVVTAQLHGALEGQPAVNGLVVAYEPVWAIGTGLTATPEQAQEMHLRVRTVLGDIPGVSAEGTRILYGGSVKAGNAASLFEAPDIDGALVGGAALVADEFLSIISAADA